MQALLLLRLEHVESMRALLSELLTLPGEDVDEEGGGMALTPVGRYTLLELLLIFLPYNRCCFCTLHTLYMVLPTYLALLCTHISPWPVLALMSTPVHTTLVVKHAPFFARSFIFPPSIHTLTASHFHTSNVQITCLLVACVPLHYL
jgi:hypothetical protein